MFYFTCYESKIQEKKWKFPPYSIFLRCTCTVFLNWWVKSAGYAYVAQKWVERPFWVGRGLYTAKETTSSTKNAILNAFMMQDFYFKRHAWKLLELLSDAVYVKKECLRKTRCPDYVSVGRWDVDRFNVSFIILSLFSKLVMK